MGKRNNIFLIFLFTLAVSSLNAQDLTVFKIKRVPVSSNAFNDIAPVIVNDGIVFCSDRRVTGISDRTSFDGSRLFNIYIAAREDTSSWKKPGEIRTERTGLFNNGPLCFAPDGRTVYFTSETETGSPSKSRSFRNSSGIFIAELTGQELTGIRPFKYNNPQYDIGQPAISPDGRFLYFVSDKPGGIGGSDIYFCELINGDWGEPVNAGEIINSSGNDNYPFIHQSGRLFFTSDRPGGLGGLDIYYSTANKGSWETPIRLAEPVNSGFDDFALTADNDLLKGFFASNRRRNDDVYEFSSIIKMNVCNPAEENNYCYEFVEENAVRYDSIPFRYKWKFGDGDTASGPRVQHCFSGPGTYIVQLDVVNLVTNEVSFNEKSDVLVVEAIQQAYISGPEKAEAGQQLRFSADSTNLPDWDITRYYWNFGDGTVAVGKNVEKKYAVQGNFTIQLIVNAKPDSAGVQREACVSKNILIIPEP